MRLVKMEQNQGAHEMAANFFNNNSIGAAADIKYELYSDETNNAELSQDKAIKEEFLYQELQHVECLNNEFINMPPTVCCVKEEQQSILYKNIETYLEETPIFYDLEAASIFCNNSENNLEGRQSVHESSSLKSETEHAALKHCVKEEELSHTTYGLLHSGIEREPMMSLQHQIATACKNIDFGGSKSYVCSYCHKGFENRSTLKLHEVCHTGEKPYACPYCHKTFNQKSNCKRHELTHLQNYASKKSSRKKARKQKSICLTCNETFSTIGLCKQHILSSHTDIKSYNHPYCMEKFCDKIDCIKPYACSYCGKKFSWSQSCKKHEKSHTSGDLFACIYCDQVFRTRHKCNKHEKTHNLCNTDKPKKNIVPSDKVYECLFCGKTFGRPEVLKRHELIHTGEKPYACDYCGKTFRFLGTWKSHELTHTGIKPYSCAYCDKMFTQIGSRKTHELTHTGSKPFACSFCGKTFSQRGHCKTHELSHTGTKPFVCSICGKAFNRNSRCKLHESTHSKTSV